MTMSSKENKIRFAVIGFGHIGKRHSAMIEAHSECELKAVADINEERKAELESRSPGVPFYKSVEELLAAEKELDVVNICTPNGVHAGLARKALTSRKHVVVEKPMGLSKQECESLIFESLHVSKHIFVVMQNRYSPPSRWLKSLVDENRFGEIYMVQINCYWNRDDRYYGKSDWKGKLDLDGGPLFTQFSHFIDIMYWLFGDIENIQAHFDNFKHRHNTEFEDSGFIHFDFVNGGIGSINYSTAVNDKNFESSITIIGEKGTVKVGGQYMDKVEYCHLEDYEMPELEASNPPNDYGDYKGSAANHHYVIQNVVDTLREKSAATTNALEGMKVVEMIERIYSFRKLK